MIVMNVYLAEKYLGHPSRVTALTALHNHTLIKATEDGRITARPFEESSEVAMCGHDGPVLGVAAFHETPFIVSGGTDTRLMIWNTETGECVRTLIGHAEAVTAVALADEGRTIVSGGADGALRFWDTLTGALCAGAEGQAGPVSVLVALPNSDEVLVGMQKAHSSAVAFQLFNYRSGTLVRAFEETPTDVICAALLEGGQLLTGSRDGKVTQWDVNSGGVVNVSETHPNSAVEALAPHGGYAVLAALPHQLIVWNLAAQQASCALDDVKEPISQIMITPDSRRVVVGCADGTVYVYRVVSA